MATVTVKITVLVDDKPDEIFHLNGKETKSWLQFIFKRIVTVLQTQSVTI